MSVPTARSTEILTEHLGFPPIALIDEIINAVNDLMYKCTKAVDKFLLEKYKSNQALSEEAERGTAQVETLLESSIDRNFDKFELYALRNILAIPNELCDGGWITLKHHEGVHLDKKAEARSIELDLKINQAFKEITQQLYIKKQLVLQINKAKKTLKLLKLYRDSVDFISQTPQLTPEALTALKSLQPLNETLYYLVQQTTDLFNTIQGLTSTFDKPVEEGGIQGLEHTPSERDRYLNVETTKLLRVLGMAKNKTRVESLLEDLDKVDLGDEEVQKLLKEKYGI